jgi:hypothetical protein
MFHIGYDTREKLAMTNAIIGEAQEFANEKNMTVIMGGDWNCPVNRIQLTAGAFMPDPMNPLDYCTEDDGIDSVIIINPVGGKPSRYSSSQDEEDDEDGQDSQDDQNSQDSQDERYSQDDQNSQDDQDSQDDQCSQEDQYSQHGQDDEDSQDDEDDEDGQDYRYNEYHEDSENSQDSHNDEDYHDGQDYQNDEYYEDSKDSESSEDSEDTLPNLTLDDVQFFRWTDKVTADDMGGLEPEYIDRIYRRGGKHRPIIANVIFEN